ncbi:flippase [Carboxydochorda subterranea]|uniref:Flippase n=1 Tax=Carboxydichorda subterranea TaxID=3109565 RepID=A0ABZ1BTY0_9FIRM|nr:flippase [Limnochorda sp. L945t]WRP16038.1 flippase [Limnochorda sp. L945t]
MVRNATALYAVRFATYVVPLVTLPYLTRVLGPESFGRLAFYQAFSFWIALLLEYGFGLSATREVAQLRASPAALSRIAAEVLGSKLVLVVPVLALSLAGPRWIPSFHGGTAYLVWAVGAAVFQGFNPLWYFQGREQLQVPAALDFAGRVVAAGAIFLAVRAPADGPVVLALQAVTSAVVTVVTTALMYRDLSWRTPTLEGTRKALKAGSVLFLLRLTNNLYTTLNTLPLGLLVPFSLVGFYAAADKVVRAALGLFGPLSQALFPHISHLVSEDRTRAHRLARLSLVAMAAAGCLMAAGVIVLAPVLVRLLFGPGYEPAIPVVRILALLMPLSAANNVLGTQWMIPLGLERSFTLTVAAAGVVNVLLAWVLAPSHGPAGMAVAVTSTEAFVTLAMLTILRRRGMLPFGAGADKRATAREGGS